MKTTQNRPSQPARGKSINLSRDSKARVLAAARAAKCSPMQIIEGCVITALSKAPERHEQFKRKCEHRKLIPVVCSDGLGPALAVDRRGRPYVEFCGKFERDPEPLDAGAWWYRQIVNDASEQGVTVFPRGQRKFLLSVVSQLRN